MSIRGYKVFNHDWTCRGFKYEVGKIYKHEGDISLCKKGFHFCRKIAEYVNKKTISNRRTGLCEHSQPQHGVY